MIIAFIIMS